MTTAEQIEYLHVIGLDSIALNLEYLSEQNKVLHKDVITFEDSFSTLRKNRQNLQKYLKKCACKYINKKHCILKSESYTSMMICLHDPLLKPPSNGFHQV